jgi:hypothetical protein
VVEAGIRLSWEAASDDQTPADGLSYNLRVGTSPGSDDVFSGMSDPATGLRHIPAAGNAQKQLSWTLKVPQTGSYYWSVQAVDTAFAGSSWAAEELFVGPDVLHVDSNPDDGTWPGCYTDLQAALADATAGDEIWVAAGTYHPTDTTDRSIPFAMVEGVALYGGFVGGETIRGQRNWQVNVTILSGDIGTAGENSDNSRHVVLGADNAVLDGFTITGGSAGGYVSAHGGGMCNYNASPIVTNCTITGNGADWYGGGMYNESSSPTVTNCTFSGNWASDWQGGGDTEGGGGMYNLDSSPLVSDCIFDGNDGCRGAGMANWSSSPTLTNCTFSGNDAYYGGGINELEAALRTMANEVYSAINEQGDI